MSLALRERVLHGTVDVPTPQLAEETVEMVMGSTRTCAVDRRASGGGGHRQGTSIWSKIDELRTQVDEMSKKMNALRVQKSRNSDQVGDRVAESGGFDPCLLLNTQIGVLMDEKKGKTAALDRLMSERQNVLDYVKGLQEQR